MPVVHPSSRNLTENGANDIIKRRYSGDAINFHIALSDCGLIKRVSRSKNLQF